MWHPPLLLHPVLSKVFPNLFGDDNEAKKYVNQLRGAVDEVNKELLRFEKYDLAWKQVVETTLNTLQDRLVKLKNGVEAWAYMANIKLMNVTSELAHAQEEAANQVSGADPPNPPFVHAKLSPKIPNFEGAYLEIGLWDFRS